MTKRSGENLILSTGRDVRIAVESLTEIFNNQTVLYRRVLGREAKIKVKRWNKILPLIEDEEAYITQITEFINCMISELSGLKAIDGTAKPKDENPIVEDYNAETITDMRSRYIAQTIVQSEEKTLDSGQVRVLLNQKEGKPFHRSMVSRVIKNLPKFLSCKVDLYAGKLRVMRIDPFFVTNHRSVLERSGL